VRSRAYREVARRWPTVWTVGLLSLLATVPAARAVEMPMDSTTQPVALGTGLMWGDMRPYPNVRSASATPRQRAKVTRLWRATRATAPRFESYPDARRLGYVFMRSAIARTGFPGLFHARKRGGQFWGRVLDPTAPQALMYWCTNRKQCTLAGFVYRAPRDSLPPLYGSLLAWHQHNAGASWMTHVWLTNGLRSAIARCMPWPALTRALGIEQRLWKVDIEGDRPCPQAGSSMETVNQPPMR
jgi:hypothetical protein